jgi:hypothetical protein
VTATSPLTAGAVLALRMVREPRGRFSVPVGGLR